MAKPAPIRCRLLPRFGLRTMFIVITVICVLLGSVMLWYRAQVAEYRRQQEVVLKIEKSNKSDGLVLIPFSIQWETQLPSWLKWMDQYKVAEPFRRAISLDFGISSFPDQPERLDEFSELSTLRTISCHIAHLTPQIVDHLARLPQLQQIIVNFGGFGPIETKDEMENQLAPIRAKLRGVDFQLTTNLMTK